MLNMTSLLYALLDFAEDKELIEREDREYCLNRLLEILQMDAPECVQELPTMHGETATGLLEPMLDLAAERGLFSDSTEQRDLFSAKLMGALTPHPKMVRDRFERLCREKGSKCATDDFYRMCRAADYIRVDRIAKNVRFFHDTDCGELEITINLSKPEKDPRDIAAQRLMPQNSYPRCMLCVENPGYAGRAGFPARQNHRVIPLTLDGEPWYMQYSPYAYYNEHCIVFNREHVPMCISHKSFVRLFDFVERFPHYILGSNADLPIVGGSILSHDHFQGGANLFPMEKSEARILLNAPEGGVEACVIDWPMSCIVLKSKDRNKLTRLADAMLEAWRGYSDAACEILAETDGNPHNTITPVARMEDGQYKLYLVLRNNRTSEKYPMGIFHPHPELHHIKKENIGLIEVMGLFILPGRLVKELEGIEYVLTGEATIDSVPEMHRAWTEQLLSERGRQPSHEAAQAVLRDGLAVKCANVLRDAGVYKRTPEGDAGIMRFLTSIGYSRA